MIMPYSLFAGLGTKPSCEKRLKRTTDSKGRPKVRIQFEPNESMREVHRFARMAIDERMKRSGVSFESAKAFVRKGGIDKHFQAHVNKSGLFNQYWFVTDIEKAYASVRTEVLSLMILRIFATDPNPFPEDSGERAHLDSFFSEFPPPIRSAYSWIDIKAYLEHHFMNPETGTGLAEGLPLSPFLFNLYCELSIDCRLRGLCKKYGIVYSRYADDLFFSSDIPIGKVKRKKIKKVIGRVFSINQEKTLFFDINDYPQGVVLNKRIARNHNGQAETLIPRKGRKEFERMVFEAYFKEKPQPEKLAGKYGSLLQKTKFFGRTEPVHPMGLLKSLTYYRMFRTKQQWEKLVVSRK